MEFIENARREKGCVFCKIAKQKKNPEKKGDLVLYRGVTCFVLMNRYPYNNGHLMVIPYDHIAELGDLEELTMLEMMWLTGKSVAILKKALKCQGANCGANIGSVAGAGIAGHVHMHVVPRWAGDSNFMPVVGNAKSMPEYLKATFKRLKPHFDKI